MRTKSIEGVSYYRYRISFRRYGQPRRTYRTLWSPGYPWLPSEITRYLNDRGDVDAAQNVYIKGPI